MLVYQRLACKKKLSPWEDSHWLPKLLALPERDGGRCGRTVVRKVIEKDRKIKIFKKMPRNQLV